MPVVNYYLKKTVGNPSGSLIYLQFKYRGRKMVFSFGQKIHSPDWSKVTKRVKSNRQTILDGRYAINDLLDKLERECQRIYQDELTRGTTPSPELLRFRLDDWLRRQQGKKNEVGIYDLFDRFIGGEIKCKGKDKSPYTLRNYGTAKGHLKGFDIATRFHVGFDNIDLDFLRRYAAWLKEDVGLKPNSISRDIAILKTVLAEAVEQGYTSNIQFRHKRFIVPRVRTEAVHLSEKEIMVIYRHDCAGSLRLEQVRDRFILGCLAGLPLTGVKGSKSAESKPMLVHSGSETFLSVPARSPGRMGMIRLPCHPVVREIMDKRRESAAPWLRTLSNQKFNKYIKDLGRLAGLTEKGRLPGAPKKELWECLSAGTAWRSMAAHYYRQGFPLHELMGITGHASEKAFFHFIGAAGPGTGADAKKRASI